MYAGKASFASTLALLLRREVPLPTALALAAEACDDAALRDDVRAMAAQAEGGDGLGEVLREQALFPPTLLWLVGMADGGRDTPRALDEVAAIYTRRLDRALDRFATIVTPLAEIVVGAVVFLFAYSFMVPLYEYAESLFRM
jgi:type II secretory pathway component PulF